MVQTRSSTLTLAEFLVSPLADEEPAWEYFPNGELVRKVSPSLEHGLLQFHAGRLFWNHLERIGADAEVVTEARAALARSSPVPDVAVYRGHFPVGPDGRLEKYARAYPLAVIEILSPGQTRRQLIEKCRDMVAHGTTFGLVIDPIGRVVVLVDADGERSYRGSDPIPLPAPEFHGLALTPDLIFARLP